MEEANQVINKGFEELEEERYGIVPPKPQVMPHYNTKPRRPQPDGLSHFTNASSTLNRLPSNMQAMNMNGYNNRHSMSAGWTGTQGRQVMTVLPTLTFFFMKFFNFSIVFFRNMPNIIRKNTLEVMDTTLLNTSNTILYHQIIMVILGIPTNKRITRVILLEWYLLVTL